MPTRAPRTPEISRTSSSSSAIPCSSRGRSSSAFTACRASLTAARRAASSSATRERLRDDDRADDRRTRLQRGTGREALPRPTAAPLPRLRGLAPLPDEARERAHRGRRVNRPLPLTRPHGYVTLGLLLVSIRSSRLENHNVGDAPILRDVPARWHLELGTQQ